MSPSRPDVRVYEAKRVNGGLRWVADLGMWALDRGNGSCVWQTQACDRCYNKSLARFVPWLQKSWAPGGGDDEKWNRAAPDAFKGLDRVRICTRGEPFASVADVLRVAAWLRWNPDTLFWITTRCWQTGWHEDGYRLNLEMIDQVEGRLLPMKNARVLASLDPYTVHFLDDLHRRGWSTNYFGSERPHPLPEAYRCPKTWLKAKGACAVCRDGCFSDRRVDVWFREHGGHAKPTPQLPLNLGGGQ